MVLIRSNAQQNKYFSVDVYLKLKGILNQDSKEWAGIHHIPLNCCNVKPTALISSELIVAKHDKVNTTIGKDPLQSTTATSKHYSYVKKASRVN